MTHVIKGKVEAAPFKSRFHGYLEKQIGTFPKSKSLTDDGGLTDERGCLQLMCG